MSLAACCFTRPRSFSTSADAGAVKIQTPRCPERPARPSEAAWSPNIGIAVFQEAVGLRPQPCVQQAVSSARRCHSVEATTPTKSMPATQTRRCPRLGAWEGEQARKRSRLESHSRDAARHRAPPLESSHSSSSPALPPAPETAVDSELGLVPHTRRCQTLHTSMDLPKGFPTQDHPPSQPGPVGMTSTTGSKPNAAVRRCRGASTAPETIRSSFSLCHHFSLAIDQVLLLPIASSWVRQSNKQSPMATPFPACRRAELKGCQCLSPRAHFLQSSCGVRKQKVGSPADIKAAVKTAP